MNSYICHQINQQPDIFDHITNSYWKLCLFGWSIHQSLSINTLKYIWCRNSFLCDNSIFILSFTTLFNISPASVEPISSSLFSTLQALLYQFNKHTFSLSTTLYLRTPMKTGRENSSPKPWNLALKKLKRPRKKERKKEREKTTVLLIAVYAKEKKWWAWI